MVNAARRAPLARARCSSPPAFTRRSDTWLAISIALLSALSVSSLSFVIIDLLAFLRRIDHTGL